MKWLALLLTWACGCEAAGLDSAEGTDPAADGSGADGGASEVPDPDQPPDPEDLPPSPTPPEGESALQYLSDGDFELPAIDTGNLKDDCLVQAPWGADSWGIVAATSSEPSLGPIAGSRFVSWGHQGYMYGRDQSGQWGRVRFVQGDVWGFTGCGPVSWRRFSPFPVMAAGQGSYDESPQLRVDVYQDTDNLLTAGDSWSMLAVRLYYSSPELTAAGNDRNGKKPVVIDHVLALSCNMASCTLDRASETPEAWHVQIDHRATLDLTPGQWKTFDISLGFGAVAAVARLGWPDYMAEELELYQAEIVLETRNAQAAAIVDNFHIEDPLQ